MATRYVYNGATGAANGTSWTDAYTSGAAADTAAGSGDIIAFAHDHEEVLSAATAYSWGAGQSNPILVLSCQRDAPSLTLMAGACIRTTGANNLTPNNTGSTYFWGMQFRAGDGANAASLILNASSGNEVIYDNCILELGGANAANTMDVRHARYWDTWFGFAHASQGFAQASAAQCEFRGGGLLAQGSPALQITELWKSLAPAAIMDGFDFSQMGPAFDIANVTGSSSSLVLRGCKLPAGWTGQLNQALAGVRSRWEMHDTDDGDTQTRSEFYSYYGSVTSTESVYRDGGPVPPGASGMSWAMVGSGNTYPLGTLNSPDLQRWNKSVGGPVTVTVHIARNSAAANLTDKQVWIEVAYKGASGYTLMTVDRSSRAADAITASGTDHAADSGATWTGLTSPTKQKIEATFTPEEEGFVIVSVRLAAATTVYVCPLFDIA